MGIWQRVRVVFGVASVWFGGLGLGPLSPWGSSPPSSPSPTGTGYSPSIGFSSASKSAQFVERAWDHLWDNLQHPQGSPWGAIVASPSRQAPDYFYHWVRDASLVMQAALGVLERQGQRAYAPIPLLNAQQTQLLHTRIRQWIQFEKRLQETPVPSGHLGEPKFLVNGFPFTGPWGRPQNDGPALRALTLLRYAKALLKTGNPQDRDFILGTLFAPELPARTLIKRDLEFVAHHWREPSFDLWEEVLGTHFYTRIVQHAALLKGAQFARDMQDPGAALFYEQQAHEIQLDLDRFWDNEQGLIVPTLDQIAGLSGKTSGQDAAVVLGVLHADLPASDPFSTQDPRVHRAAQGLSQVFQHLYPINQQLLPHTSLWGRYPEDVYDGVGFSQGHAWFITTHAHAEFLCKSGENSKKLEGKQLLERVQRYVTSEGKMTEQIHRSRGEQRGATDLSWSYASALTAQWACGGL